MSKIRLSRRRPASLPVFGAGWDFSKNAAALSTPARKIFELFFRPPVRGPSGLSARGALNEPLRLADPPCAVNRDFKLFSILFPDDERNVKKATVLVIILRLDKPIKNRLQIHLRRFGIWSKSKDNVWARVCMSGIPFIKTFNLAAFK